jgi:hypothetical protein
LYYLINIVYIIYKWFHHIRMFRGGRNETFIETLFDIFDLFFWNFDYLINCRGEFSSHRLYCAFDPVRGPAASGAYMAVPSDRGGGYTDRQFRILGQPV